MKNIQLECLKNFLKKHFDFATLKKVGFFKYIKHNEYEKQAARICLFFGYESVYEYGQKEIRVHLSYGGLDPAGIGTYRHPSTVDKDGNVTFDEFITVLFPNQLHI